MIKTILIGRKQVNKACSVSVRWVLSTRKARRVDQMGGFVGREWLTMRRDVHSLPA